MELILALNYLDSYKEDRDNLDGTDLMRILDFCRWLEEDGEGQQCAAELAGVKISPAPTVAYVSEEVEERIRRGLTFGFTVYHEPDPDHNFPIRILPGDGT